MPMPKKPEKKAGAAKTVSSAKKRIPVRKIVSEKEAKPIHKHEIAETKLGRLSEESESFLAENFSNQNAEFKLPKTSKPFVEKEELSDKPREVAPKERSLHLYRKISISFIVLTGLLLAFIFYFSFVKVEIKVKPKKESVNNNLIADINSESGTAREGAIVGEIKEVELETSQEFDASGKNVIGQEAIGKVKIINNYNKNQPLVATTRLLSSDNKLFRIKDTVNVPANGSVEVDIYADEPSSEMAIGPSKFTIPGLWAGLQNQIYAESSEAVKYQEKVQRIIQPIDIEGAREVLEGKLTEMAKTDSATELQGKYSQLLFKINKDTVVAETDAKAGEEKDKFTLKIKGKVGIVAFNDAEIRKIAEQKLKAALPESRKLAGFDQDKLTYNLTDFDIAQGSASVEVNFSGEAIAKDESVLDKSKLVGLTADQLNDYLASLPEIESFEVKFRPAFISKVPELVDSIKIETIE